jgi:hypothetical protein
VLDYGGVLDQIGAEQQAVLRPQAAREGASEAPARASQEVAQRAAEEDHDPGSPRRGERVEVALEVAEDALHAHARVVLDELLGARAQHGFRDVEGDVAVERAGVAHRVQQ